MELKYLLVISSLVCAATAASVSLQTDSTIDISGINFTAPEDCKALLARVNSTSMPWGNCYKQPQLLGRHAVKNVSLKWKDNTLVYSIDYPFTTTARNKIRLSMQQISDTTCIKFVQRTTQTDYVSITGDSTGCWSAIGRNGGKQFLNLQSPQCFPSLAPPIHELYHSLGILHEHERYDRSLYIDVLWDNMPVSAWSQFQMISRTLATTYGLPYDYGSVMHYENNAFSNNTKDTLKAKSTSAPAVFGNRVGPTALDILKLKTLYNCP